MEDQYGMADLRPYIDGRPFFPAVTQPPDLLSCHRGGMTSSHPYDNNMLVFPAPVGFEAEPAGLIGGAGRWPRQETLTLLQIRSRLDHKFKEANQKGPLWDEVSRIRMLKTMNNRKKNRTPDLTWFGKIAYIHEGSTRNFIEVEFQRYRIMSEENGYQRSGKKCREKFENLYKYYKKTKEGKAGRQDGKHYRFFRQLEALYGETSNSVPHFQCGNFTNTLASDQEGSAPDSCDYDTTSSYCSDSNIRLIDITTDKNDPTEKKRRVNRSLKAKIEASVESHMKSMMEKQEAWMEKMTRVIESKERERFMREEEWRKQDTARIEREQEMWASERAWIEPREVALMEAFNKLAEKGPDPQQPWMNGMDLRCEANGIREKWDQIINDYRMKCSKKRSEKSKSCVYSYPILNNQIAGVEGAMRLNGYGSEAVNDGLFSFFEGDSYQRL